VGMGSRVENSVEGVLMVERCGGGLGVQTPVPMESCIVDNIRWAIVTAL